MQHIVLNNNVLFTLYTLPLTPPLLPSFPAVSPLLLSCRRLLSPLPPYRLSVSLSLCRPLSAACWLLCLWVSAVSYLLFGTCCLLPSACCLSVCIVSAIFYLPSAAHCMPSAARSRLHCLLSFLLLTVVCCLLSAVLPPAACCPVSARLVSACCAGMYCVISAIYCQSAVPSFLLYCCPLSLPNCAAVV